MRQVAGIWLPDGDRHFDQHLVAGPFIDSKGTYQHRKYAAALVHVGRRNLAVDIGGHVGLWSRVMARDFARVVAFEPLAAHRECFALNAPGVELRPFAVGKSAGRAKVKMPHDNTGSAHVGGSGEDCEVVTYDLTGVDFLKIDVEGYETDVLLGGEDAIRADKPVICIEQKPGNAERYGRGRWDAVGLLKDWGAREVAVISGDHILVW